MHDVMTPAEKTLAATGNAPAVTNMRHLFQDTMQTQFSAAIERLSGRGVVAFISGNHLDPDMAAELLSSTGTAGRRLPASRPYRLWTSRRGTLEASVGRARRGWRSRSVGRWGACQVRLTWTRLLGTPTRIPAPDLRGRAIRDARRRNCPARCTGRRSAA